MLETIFANPGFLAAGGALVSAPIIIHLINRMRFKRLRWAAMEFLLKAQRRNRRRLIIEQLLLLLLRCTLVALLALLVSRLVPDSGAAAQDAREFTHIVLLDDSLSMTDQWRDKEDNNKIKSAFGIAKDVIKNKVLHTISRSSTNDKLMLMTLSRIVLEGDKFQPSVYSDLGFADKRKEVETELTGYEPTKLHLDMEKGLVAIKNVVKNVPSGRVLVHIFTDLRETDWGLPHGKKLLEEAKALALMKKADKDLKIEDLRVIVNDTAHPGRGGRGGRPGSHDNLALVDFRPATRVAGKGMPVLFTVTLANYGAREAEVDVDFFDNTTGKRIPDIDLNPTPPLKVSAGLR